MAASTSCIVFDATFVHHTPASFMQSSGADDGGPLVSRMVKLGKFGGEFQNNILLSDVC